MIIFEHVMKVFKEYRAVDDVSLLGSSIMTLGIRLVQERTQGWARFMRITPLPYSVYFFSKIISQSVIHILSIAVIFAAGMLINGVTLSIGKWVMSGVWILFGAFPFLGLGALVGTMKKVDTASGVSNVIYSIGIYGWNVDAA